MNLLVLDGGCDVLAIKLEQRHLHRNETFLHLASMAMDVGDIVAPDHQMRLNESEQMTIGIPFR